MTVCVPAWLAAAVVTLLAGAGGVAAITRIVKAR